MVSLLVVVVVVDEVFELSVAVTIGSVESVESTLFPLPITPSPYSKAKVIKARASKASKAQMQG